jgi:asparagine synthase (glutamine-hydrolysing)
MGGYPLFWTTGAEMMALSTSVYPLLTLLPQRVLNADYIAEYLMLPGQMQELPSEQCVYAGISRLMPGTVITMHVPTQRVHLQRYWQWLEKMVEPDTTRQEALSEQYAHLVRQAVRERLHGRTASHLSGGMDSTSITTLAHNWLCAGVGQAPLHTLSLVYDRLSDLSEETPYLENVVEQLRGIVPHRIPADELLDFDSFAAPPPHDEPYVGLRRLPLDRATIDAAARCGAVTMLTGLGADEMTVASPFHITDLLQRHSLRTAWAEACRWARIDNCSPWHLLVLYGVSNSLPAWMRGGLHAWLHRGYATWDRQNKWTIAPWITPSFARQYALRTRAVEQARQTFNACQPTGLSFALSLIRSRMGDVNRWAIAAPYNLAVAHPFLDPRVLCFSLGIHATRRPDPCGQKPLLAHAMHDVLPAAIRQRRRKADFSVVYYGGLSRNLQHLEAMIHQVSPDDLPFFDKATLLRCLRQAALGAARGVDGTHKLNLTLSLLTWWRMQSAWQHPLAPARVIYPRCDNGAS